MGWRFVDLDVAVLDTGMVLQLPLHGVEGIANHYIDIFMGMIVVVFLGHDQFLTRGLQVDAKMIQFSFLLMPMGGFNYHPAAHDVIMKLLQFGGFITNTAFQGWGRLHMPKGNL